LLHLKLTIAYDGTGLVGWQRQATGTSVQALLEDALLPLNHAPVTVVGAGRTDAGVHALAQVASVTLARAIEPASVVRAVNMRLPPSVRVLTAERVESDFHARFRAIAKTYRYRIWNGEVVSPFERPYVWHVAGPVLDRAAMADAARRLVGRHDFAAFQSAGSDAETTERTVFASDLHEGDERCPGPASDRDGASLVVYEIRGDGFLRHMVRAIVGSLVEIGRGRRPPSWIDEVLTSRDRHEAGRTAPSSGLFLVRVEYP
jgi:tRNA pseudouridine38-40 synthase